MRTARLRPELLQERLSQRGSMKQKFNYAALIGPVTIAVFWVSLFLLKIYR